MAVTTKEHEFIYNSGKTRIKERPGWDFQNSMALIYAKVDTFRKIMLYHNNTDNDGGRDDENS